MNARPYAQRATAPRCRGGASSLLRLSTANANRWPSPTALDGWADRASQLGLLAAEPEPPRLPAAEAPSQLFTRLWPSAGCAFVREN